MICWETVAPRDDFCIGSTCAASALFKRVRFSPTLQPLQTLTHAAVTRQKPPSAEGAGLIGAAVRRSVLEFELADSSRHQNQCRRRSTRRSPGCTLDAWFAWRDDRAEAMAKVHAYVERALARSRQRRRQHCVGRADVDGEAVRRGGGRGAAPNGRKARLHNRGVAQDADHARRGVLGFRRRGAHRRRPSGSRRGATTLYLACLSYANGIKGKPPVAAETRLFEGSRACKCSSSMKRRSPRSGCPPQRDRRGTREAKHPAGDPRFRRSASSKSSKPWPDSYRRFSV